MIVSPKFKLKNAKSGVSTSIILKVYLLKQRFTWGTGEMVHPDLWDFEIERPTKNAYQIRKAAKLNPFVKTELLNLATQLDNFKAETQRLFSYWQRQGIQPTNELFVSQMDKIFKPAPVEVVKVAKPTDTDLNLYVQQFIKEIQTGQRTTTNGKHYEKGTVKNYLNFQVELNEYQKQRHIKLTFADITLDFYRDYLAFFNDKNYSPNTIGRHIKHLKRILGAALAQNLHSNLQFKLTEFTAMQVESPAIYLTVHEVERLEKLGLSHRPKLEETRDMFLVGCYTAQRFSDYSRVNDTMIKETGKGNRVIELIQKKTGKRVIIPLNPKLETILAKYGGKLPKVYEQKLNTRIKEVGKLAAIDALELVEVIRGGLKVKKQLPKYELIKTHTARRTAATNMYLSGLPFTDIMKITGHTTAKHLQNYIKVTKEETADRVAMHPYFTGKKPASPLKVAK